ncbi:MAG: anhydro-N-acetylmuramic acid kinase [Marinoscillum sp.]
MSEYHVVGVMSGSSLDGLDICACHFVKRQKWSFQIMATQTIPIPDPIKHRLKGSDELSTEELDKLDVDYGEWIATTLEAWLIDQKLKPELIGIHGHTVFHDPSQKVSLQLGNGRLISKRLRVSVVDNFRVADILNGGQGAPLVPVGEHYLFSGYRGFINLGGIANIALHKHQITAWDIAPCNQVLNFFAEKCGLPFDESGLLAREGKIDQKWIAYLHSLKYFYQKPPKSLSNQWTQQVLKTHPSDPKDGLASYCSFLSSEIAKALEPNAQIMVTGGGAHNLTLMEMIRSQSPGNCEIVVPDIQLVEFKEALVFGFLAVLRKLNIPNVFASVTGAQEDTVSGDLHLPVS